METDRVIFDHECKEYMEGWNANNNGGHFLANPYSCVAYDGELYRLWQRGYNDNFQAWNSADRDLPKSFSPFQIKNAFTIVNKVTAE